MNMYQFLEQVAKQSPDALYLVREKITFKEVLKLIHARATTLRDAGVKAGDVIGLLAHNIPEFPVTLFAIWYLGGTVLLLDRESSCMRHGRSSIYRRSLIVSQFRQICI